MVETRSAVRRMLGTPPPGGINIDSPAPYGWAPLIVLFLVGLVDRLEYNLMAGMLPLLKAEWGFSDTLAGSLPTAGPLAPVAVALPAGHLAGPRDRTRRVAVLA